MAAMICHALPVSAMVKPSLLQGTTKESTSLRMAGLIWLGGCWTPVNANNFNPRIAFCCLNTLTLQHKTRRRFRKNCQGCKKSQLFGAKFAPRLVSQKPSARVLINSGAQREAQGEPCNRWGVPYQWCFHSLDGMFTYLWDMLWLFGCWGRLLGRC